MFLVGHSCGSSVSDTPLTFFFNHLAGYTGVASFSCNDTNYTILSGGHRERRFLNLIPTIIKGIQCLGSERDVLDCAVDAIGGVIGTDLFQALPPGSPVPVEKVAYISCTSKYTLDSSS